MNSEQNTLPTLETIAATLGEMRREMGETRREMNERFDKVEQRLDRVEQRVGRMEEKYDQKFEDMRLQMMSFDVRIDRLQAASHKVLEITINTRADVKVLREEVHAWAKEVANLSKLPV